MSAPRELLTRPHHLAARLFGSLRSTPPSVDDLAWADQYLLDGERTIFHAMSDIDQTHSITVARRFVAARPDSTRAEVAGALLHDVGKTASNLSTWERVAASVVGGRTERYRSYHDHERIGSEMAAAAGSDPATVDLIAERGPAFATLHECDHA